MFKQDLNKKDEYLDRLFQLSSIQLTYRKGARIYKRGDAANGIYRVLKGRIKLGNTKTSRKRTGADRGVIFHIIYRFDIFGVLGFYDKKRVHRCTATALDEEVIILFISFSEFEKYIFNSDSGNFEMIRILIAHCETNWTKYCDLQTMNLDQLVLEALLKIAKEGGVKTNKGIVIKGISQKDLADYIGISRQSVTSIMNRLKRLGKIEYSRCEILVK